MNEFALRPPPLRRVPRRRPGTAVQSTVRAVVRQAAPLLAALLLALAGCQGEKQNTGSEGTAAVPIAIGAAPGASFSGTVGQAPASSFYSVTTPTGLATRVITLTNLTDDADLAVFTDAGFASKYCSSSTGGTATESCSPPSPVDTAALYIQVKSYSATGTTYLLTVN